MKTLLITLSLLIVLLGTVAGAGWSAYQRFLEEPLDIPPGGVVIQVQPGAAGHAVLTRLSGDGITQLSWKWRLLMRLEPVVIRAGEYRLENGLRPRELMQLLSSSKVVPYRFTIVEGWTYRQLLAALAAGDVLLHGLATGPGEPVPDISSELGLEHPEGWFLPETYQFTRGDSDRDILIRAHAAMQSALETAWAARSEDNPVENPYELLTLASIVEKETALDEERGRIAGVFTRRLKKGMRLQTDPTVIYGLGEQFDGNIRRRDLENDTPYNTYTRFGLPPTPIALPGRASLMAAARPEEGAALFFVADGKGGHTFSDTLEEHREAVRKLVRKK
jgi:UPF0755 protein